MTSTISNNKNEHGVKRFNSPFSAGHWTCLEGNYLWLIQESS
ncbi:hypothetical protein C5167_029577 [Papaver somniferum]|nr:hypothetical protein C5167_029577 [Papaver somniferum]